MVYQTSRLIKAMVQLLCGVVLRQSLSHLTLALMKNARRAQVVGQALGHVVDLADH